MTQAITPTAIQSRILGYRGHVFGILSSGARGSGKSVAAQLDAVDYAATWGHDATIIIVREQFAALMELQDNLYRLCQMAIPGTTRNKNDNVINCGNGATFYFTNCSDEDSVSKMMGRSAQFLLLDECGNYTLKGWRSCQILRANLRAKPGQPIRCHATCNPMGRLHNTIYKSFVLMAPPFVPFHEKETGLLWVWTTSDFTQNPHITPDEYEKQIIAATVNDPKKQSAWRTGAWEPMGAGAMFSLFDANRHVLAIPHSTYLGPVKSLMSLDFGMTAPSVLLLGQKLYERRGHLERGSVLIRAEHATVENWLDLDRGDGTPPATLARIAREMGAPFKTKEVIADDYKGFGQDETVIKILNREGLNASRPVKDRCGGWAAINQLLYNTLRGEGPGLYIDPSCRYLLETIVDAYTDEHRREDISTKFTTDHALDSANYLVRGLISYGARSTGRVVGGW